MSRPATWKIRRTASVTSGPIPSPGIKVMTRAMLLPLSAVPHRRHAPGQQRRDRLEQLPIGGPEGGAAVAVDVDLAEDFAALHDRHDDLRSRVDAAGEI